jgi:membrane-associated protease RseP (regulator of RpoE activity)
MRTHIWTVIALLAFVPLNSQAAQNWSYGNAGEQPWVFSSEDGGSTSYLGVDIADVTAERLSALKLKDEKGVEVTMVDQDAPAGKAGIKEHDVILTMNGTTVESGAQLRRMIHETPPGRIVSFGLSRDGQPMTVKVQLADKHKEFSFVSPKGEDYHVNIPEIHIPDIDIPSMNMVVVTQSARSGLMVENITPQLGDFFGVKNGNGVLVRSVDKGSRAEKAGFRAGDVIVKVNNQAVHDTSDFSHAVRSRTGDSVNVGVMRDKKEQTLTLSLPPKKESGDLIEEESFGDEPIIRAESAAELSKLRDEIASLRPEMELAKANSRKAAEELRDALRKEQDEFRKQSEKQREQLRKDMEIMRQQWRRWRADWL